MSREMNFIVRLVILALSAMVAAHLLGGVYIDGFEFALILAAVLALLNALVKPLLIILTIPFTVMTFGLFLIVVNTIILLIAEAVIKEVQIDGFWWAMLFSLVMSFINSVFERIAGTNKQER